MLSCKTILKKLLIDTRLKKIQWENAISGTFQYIVSDIQITKNKSLKFYITNKNNDYRTFKVYYYTMNNGDFYSSLLILNTDSNKMGKKEKKIIDEILIICSYNSK